MKKFYLLLITLLFGWGWVNAQDPCNGDATVSDADGNSYNVVSVGNQCWMGENLKVTQYADETSIDQVSDKSAWSDLTNEDKAFSYYDNSEAGSNGALYTWAAAMNGAESTSAQKSEVQGVCPVGWHLPSKKEWESLANYVDQDMGPYAEATVDVWDSVGVHLKDASGWNSGNGTDDYGFSAMATGYRDVIGDFQYGTSYAYWWSATSDQSSYGDAAQIYYDAHKFYLRGKNRSQGHAVRCVKDVDMEITVDSVAFVSCDTCADGAIAVSATSDFPPFTYEWDNGATDSLITGLTRGGYTVTVTDALSYTTTQRIAVRDTSLSMADGSTHCDSLTTITDADGNTYDVVPIGGQCWMAENLRTRKLPDSSNLTYVYNEAGWDNLTSGAKAYSWLDDDNNKEEYGAFYTLAAAEKACPDGWRLPTQNEWNMLAQYISNDMGPYTQDDQTWNNVGNHLKDYVGWGAGNNGTNDYGFTALPAGYRSTNGGFHSTETHGYYWGADKGIELQRSSSDLVFSQKSGLSGASVRCIRDYTLEIANDSVVYSSCETCTDGQISIQVNGDYPPYTIEWTTEDDRNTVISEDTTLTDLGEGGYWVTITDTMGYTIEHYYPLVVEYYRLDYGISGNGLIKTLDGELKFSLTQDSILRGNDATPVVAIPDSTYKFVSWNHVRYDNGDRKRVGVYSYDDTLEVNEIADSLDLLARFTKEYNHVITLYAENGGYFKDNDYYFKQLFANEYDDKDYFSARSDEGFLFEKWVDEDSVEIYYNELTIEGIQEDKEYTAYFVPDSNYSVIHASGYKNAKVDIKEQAVQNIEDAKPITVTPDEGYHLKGWVIYNQEDNILSSDLTFKPDSFASYRTICVKDTFEVTFIAKGAGFIKETNESGQHDTLVKDVVYKWESRYDEPGFKTMEVNADTSYKYYPSHWENKQGDIICYGDDLLVDNNQIISDTTFIGVIRKNEPKEVTILYDGGWHYESWSGGLSGTMDTMPGKDTTFTIEENSVNTNNYYADEGYAFYYWQNENGEIISFDSYVRGIAGDTTLVPVYGKDTSYTLTLEATPGGYIGDYYKEESYKEESFGVSGYNARVEVKAEADPAGDYVFLEWQDTLGNVYSTEQEFVFDGSYIQDDFKLIAVFVYKLNYDATFTAGENGTLTGDTNQTIGKRSIEYAKPVEAVPDESYQFKGWQNTDGQIVSTNNPFVLDAISSDIAYKAVFAKAYTLSFAVGNNGSLSGETDQTVTGGDDAEAVEAVPAADYRFVEWQDADGNSYSTDNPLTVSGVSSDLSLTAVFESSLGNFLISFTAGDNGSISGETSQTIDEGSDATEVEAIADDGYRFVEWQDADGNSYSTDNSLMVTGVTEDLSLTAVFVDNSSFSVSFGAGANGGISGDSPQTIANGGDASAVEAIADDGYRFVEWQDADGNSYSTDNPLTVNGVTEDLSLTTVFESTSSIRESDAAEFALYPNPADDYVYIEGPAGNFDVSLYSLTGNVVLNKTAVQNILKLDVSDLEQGVYMIKVTYQGSESVYKLIK